LIRTCRGVEPVDHLIPIEDIAMAFSTLIMLGALGFGGHANGLPTAQAAPIAAPQAPSKCPPVPSKCPPAPAKHCPTPQAPSKCPPAPAKHCPEVPAKACPQIPGKVAPAPQAGEIAPAPIKAAPQA
jgi:hypothetical protein